MPTLADYKAPYPEPTAEQKRYVIILDPKGDDAELHDLKVQLMPGRIESVDGANHHSIGGNIREETIQGWGYDYYVVELGPMFGTLMMPLGDAAKKTPKFVPMACEKLIRYNSKLPIVVYTPKDCVLKYRIWSCNGGNTKDRGIEAKEG